MRPLKSLLVFIVLSSMILCVLPLSASASTSALVNKFDKSKAVSGYVSAKNVLVAHEMHYMSDYISVKEGDTVYFGPANPEQGFHLHGYNSSKEIIDASVSLSGTNSSRISVVDDSFHDMVGAKDDFSNHNFVKHVVAAYKVPAGVTSIRIANAYKYNDIFLVTVNQPFDVKSFYDYWTANGNVSVAKGYGTYFEPKRVANLYGKSILFLGDSITYANNKTSLYYDRGWPGRIAAVNNMTYVNAGRRGASLSTVKTNRIITSLNENKSKKFDFVIMHGGVNDAWNNATVGTMSTSFNKSDFNTATFAGALEELFYEAKNNANWKNAKFGFIINYQLPKHTEGKTSDMSEYFAVAKKICDKWEIPYLDLYSDYNLNYNILKVDQASTFTSGDFCHIKSNGYDKLHPYIQSWLETLGVDPEDIPKETEATATTKPTENPTEKPTENPTEKPTEKPTEALTETVTPSESATESTIYTETIPSTGDNTESEYFDTDIPIVSTDVASDTGVATDIINTPSTETNITTEGNTSTNSTEQPPASGNKVEELEIGCGASVSAVGISVLSGATALGAISTLKSKKSKRKRK